MPNSPASETSETATGEAGGAQEPAGAQRTAEAPERDLEAERQALEDRYKRALADLDNYRKRSAREVERRVTEGRDAMARDWFDAVDSVERALRMGEPENPMFEGLRGVLEQMEAVLERQGVSRVGAAGEPFDPERHEAVGVRTTDEVPDGRIVEVARSGFATDDRVLRPAQVIVARNREREG